MNQRIYLHLRKKPGRFSTAFAVVKLAKTRDASTRDGDVVLPVEIDLPNDFFDRAAITVKVQPLTGEKIR
jgi:hypothetical protein